MTTLDQLTEDIVSAYLSDKVFTRGRSLFLHGAVSERILIDGNTLIADVNDSYPFNTQAYFEGQGLIPDCECGRSSGRSVCVHVAALLLAWVNEPASFERAGAPIALGPATPPPATARRSSAVVQPADAEREVAQLLSLLPVPHLRDLANAMA
jgi:uncharacterized Zn finger protein